MAKINESLISLINLSGVAGPENAFLRPLMWVTNFSTQEALECLVDGFSNLNKSNCFLILFDSTFDLDDDILKKWKLEFESSIDEDEEILIKFANEKIFFKPKGKKSMNESHEIFSRVFNQLKIDSDDLMSCKIDAQTILNHYEDADEIVLKFLSCFEFENKLNIHQNYLRYLMQSKNLSTFEKFLDKKMNKIQTLPVDGKKWNVLEFMAGEAEIQYFKAFVSRTLGVFGKIESNCAWNNEKIENLMVLLKHDAPYPDNFDIDKIATPEWKQSFEHFLESRRNFYESIEKGSIDEIRNFVKENPKIRICYKDNENTSALETALKTAISDECFEIYAFLRAKGFTTDDNDSDNNYMKLESQLSNDQRKKITLLMQGFFGKNRKSHVNYMIAKSRVAFVENEGDAEKIAEIFDRLDEIEDIQILLKVCEHKNFNIFFGFNDFAVDQMVLTDDINSRTSGICYYGSSVLYIAAKDYGSNPNINEKIIGVVAHELAHYVMDILFDNKCLPFDHEVDQKKFTKIFDDLRSSENNHEVIERVFNVKNYNKSEQLKELIVRVPHLQAGYPKDSQQLLNKYSDLNLYYKDVVIKRAKFFLSEPEHFLSIKKIKALNENLSYCDFEMKFNDKTNDFLSFADELSVVNCNVPKLLASHLYQKFCDDKKITEMQPHVFISSAKLANQALFEKVFLEVKNVKTATLVVFCENFDENDEFWEILDDHRTRCKVIIVASKEADCVNLMNFFENKKCKEIKKITYNFSDLSDCSKKKIMQKNVDFQSEIVELEDLVRGNEAIISMLPMKELLDCKQLKLGNDIELSKNYDHKQFIHRTIHIKKKDKVSTLLTTENFEELAKYAEENKIVVISDFAGTGKSTALTYLATKMKQLKPNHFVTKIHLQEHAKLFEKSIEDPSEFLYQNFFTRQYESAEIANFAKKIYEISEVESRVIVMFDGLDEISPKCDKYFLEFLKKINDINSDIQIWVTCRSHLKSKLEEELKTECFEFVILTPEEQINLIVNLWTKKYGKNEKLRAIADKIVKLTPIFVSDSQNSLMAIPLLTGMMAEIYESDVADMLENDKQPADYGICEIYSLYRKFVTVQTLIARNEKGNEIQLAIAEEETNPIEPISIVSIYHQLALHELLKIEHKVNQRKLHLIQLYGIVTIYIDEPAFRHRSFAEYFTASYLASVIMQKTYDSEPWNKDFLILKIFTALEFFPVRHFLNGIFLHLSRKDYQESCESFGKFLVKQVSLTSDKRFKNFMSFLAEENLIYLLNYIVNCIRQCDNDAVKSFLSTKGEVNPNNAYHAQHEFLEENIFQCVVRKQIKFLIEKIWKIAKHVFGASSKEYFLMPCKARPDNKPEEMRNVLQRFFKFCDFFNPSTYQFETKSLEEQRTIVLNGNKPEVMNLEYYLDNVHVNTMIEIVKSFNLPPKTREEFVRKCESPLVQMIADKHYKIYPFQIRLGIKLREALVPEIPMWRWFKPEPSHGNNFLKVILWHLDLPNIGLGLLEILFNVMEECLDQKSKANLVFSIFMKIFNHLVLTNEQTEKEYLVSLNLNGPQPTNIVFEEIQLENLVSAETVRLLNITHNHALLVNTFYLLRSKWKKEEIRNFLMTTRNSENMNLLQYTCGSGDMTHIRAIFNFVYVELENWQFFGLLREKLKTGQNILHPVIEKNMKSSAAAMELFELSHTPTILNTLVRNEKEEYVIDKHGKIIHLMSQNGKVIMSTTKDTLEQINEYLGTKSVILRLDKRCFQIFENHYSLLHDSAKARSQVIPRKVFPSLVPENLFEENCIEIEFDCEKFYQF